MPSTALNKALIIEKMKTIHDRKLEILYMSINNSIDTDKEVINLSNRSLNTSELDMVSFCVHKYKIESMNNYFAFENLANTLKRLSLPVQQWDKLVKEISSKARDSFREFDQLNC